MIGEKLEEARKRKGISIREAAEATKIRGEYLMAMESNSFDIDLPDIYIRGFLKNYGRFLKLDPERLITDYEARQLGRAQPAGKAVREVFGHMELPQEEEEAGAAPAAPAGHPASSKPPPTLEKEPMRDDPVISAENRELYLKVGVVFGGVLALLLILFLLIRLIMGGGNDAPADPIVQGSNTTQTTGTSSQPVATTGPETITLRATDVVTIIVEQTIDRKRLFSGTLNAGDPLSLEKEGPVSIRFTNGAALTIEKGGQQFRPGQSGVGRTMVD